MTAELSARLARRTLALCEVPSPYGEERALADAMEAWARRLPWAPPVARIGNALVIGELGGQGRPTLALVGHLDTVPPHEDEPPPAIEGDRVRGLGASDMKGGLAVIQCLLEDLPPARTGAALLAILYDKEEGPHEQSGLGGVLGARPDLGAIDLAVVLEPTSGVVEVGCLGSLHARVVFQGRAAHSARPWEGENAITRAGALLSRLHALEPRPVEVGGHTFREVVTVTLAEGGRYRNVVPDRFELNLNLRFAPGVTIEEAQERLRSLVGEAEGVSITFTDLAPAGSIPEGNPLLDRLIEVGGLSLAPKNAWTDVARLSAAGIDAVNLGPGRGDQAHRRGEFCEVPSLVRVYEALSSLLSSL